LIRFPDAGWIGFDAWLGLADVHRVKVFHWRSLEIASFCPDGHENDGCPRCPAFSRRWLQSVDLSNAAGRKKDGPSIEGPW
jgi:hypothetical protein